MNEVTQWCTVYGLVIWLLWLGCVDAQLTSTQRTGVIIGSVLGGTVLLIIIVVLLVLCCKSSKKHRKIKKKNEYLKYHDPTPFTVQDQKPTNGYVHNKSPNKIGRSISDVQTRSDYYGYIKPGPPKGLPHNEGSVISNHDSASELSVPSGIWTSNPTLVHGLYGSKVIVAPSGVNGAPKQRPANLYGSEPVLNTMAIAHLPNGNLQPRKGQKHKHETKEEFRKSQGNQDIVWSRGGYQPRQTVQRDSRGPEDKKKLISPNAEKRRSLGDEPSTVARAYSNAGFQKQPNAVPSSNTSVGDNRFIARVYSDYQLPKDYIPGPPKPHITEQAGKVVSGHSPNTEDKHRNSNGHVAKATVRTDNTLSTGEPMYVYPQDAYQMTQSDLNVHNRTTNHLARTQSTMERPPVSTDRFAAQRNSKPQRSASQQVGRHGQVISANTNSLPHHAPDGQMRGPFWSPYNKGVYMRQTSSSQQVSKSPTKQSKKQNKDKRKSKESKKVETVPSNVKVSKKQQKLSRHQVGDNRVPLNIQSDNRLSLDVQSAQRLNQAKIQQQTVSSELRPDDAVFVHNENITDVNNIQNRRRGSLRSISESSSVTRAPSTPNNHDSHGRHIPPAHSQTEQFPSQQELDAIYSAPLKKDQRPNSQIEASFPETPLSPEPPPVPPVTKLREESLDPSEQRTPSVTPSVSSRRRAKSHISDGDGVSTGIGDAFRFLEDFDAASFDGELEEF